MTERQGGAPEAHTVPETGPRRELTRAELSQIRRTLRSLPPQERAAWGHLARAVLRAHEQLRAGEGIVLPRMRGD